MPSQAEFEYTYRWADLATLGLSAVVDELEARDVALEEHLLAYGGNTCAVDFQYQYRWAQILEAPLAEQIAMLNARDMAFEQAVRNAGGCILEFPFRWVQFWDALLLGESWAIGIAEENDRAIEMRFGLCSCFPGFTLSYGGNSCSNMQTSAYTLEVDATAVRITMEGNNEAAMVTINVVVNGIIVETLPLPEGPYTIDETISVPLFIGDEVYLLLSQTADPADDVDITGVEVDFLVPSASDSVGPIGAAFEYVVELNEFIGGDPTDIIGTASATVPGTNTPAIPAVASVLLPTTGDSITVETDGYNTNPAIISIEYDINSMTAYFTKLGSDPVTVTISFFGSEAQTTVSAPGSYSVTIDPLVFPGPYGGPSTNTPSMGSVFALSVTSEFNAGSMCVSDAVLFIDGEGEDQELTWPSG